MEISWRRNPQLMLWIVLIKCSFFLQMGDLLCSCSVPVESAPLPKMRLRSKCVLWNLLPFQRWDSDQSVYDLTMLRALFRYGWAAWLQSFQSCVAFWTRLERSLIQTGLNKRLRLCLTHTSRNSFQGLFKDQSLQSIQQTPWISATLVIFQKVRNQSPGWITNSSWLWHSPEPACL